jgi:hypothetical protein
MTDYDPYDSAMAAKPLSQIRTSFGEVVELDLWPCVLVKGEGKSPFDAGVHSIDQRRTAIDILIVPLRGDYNVEYKIIVESNDWTKFLLPSLKALNLDLRNLKGKFVQFQRVPTGRKFPDKTTGELKDHTALKILAVYPDAEACQAAADEFFFKAAHGGEQPAQVALPTPTNGKPTQMERSKAASFLPLLWQSAGKDPARFVEMISKTAAVAEHFDVTSPEVQALIAPVPF